MLDTNKLRFRFKGSRNYIQGGDIFNALEQLFSEHDKHVLELSFRHFSGNQMVCVLDNPGETAKAEGKAVSDDGSSTPFWLVESAEPVTDRYAFDEDAITGHAKIEGKIIEANATPAYSVIEQVIALTKALNYALAPEIKGKWVFGQLRLLTPLPKAVKRLRIRQKTLLAGRFSVQEIELDGVDVGQIRFITSES